MIKKDDVYIDKYGKIIFNSVSLLLLGLVFSLSRITMESNKDQNSKSSF